MKKTNSSTPAKAAAARDNGRKGGTKSPKISRFNAVGHALNTKKLSILEGRHLPEYGEYASLHAELTRMLSPLTVADSVAIDKFIADAWRLRRAYRFELSATEKTDAGMLCPGMPNLLRYLNSANRQFADSYARIKEICKEKNVLAAAQLASAASRDLDGDRPSQPDATDALSPTSPVSVESFPASAATSHLEEKEVGQTAESSLTDSAAFPGQAVQYTPAAEGAQPAQHPAADVSLTSTTEEELNCEHEGKVGQMAKSPLSATALPPDEAADSSSSVGSAQPAQGQEGK